ncbi:MAG: leucine-rich repeat domain-containing protein, partial [Candidatus Heimdallarchaeaceae archaeon]
ARCYKAKKEYPRAIELYEKSLALNPKHLKSLKELEHIYRKIKDNKNAIKIGIAGTEFYPKDFYFQYWLSNSYNRSKDLVDAFLHFIKAQKLFPRVEKVTELFNALETAYYQSASFKQRIITQENFRSTGLRGNLDLSNKGIKSLDKLGLFDILNHLLVSLSLDNNNIEKITCLETASQLTSLAIRKNNIKKISGLDNLTKLEKLFLSGNKITKIEGLESLTNLVTLNLFKNQITSITDLSQLKSLKILNLSYNNLSSIKNIDLLTNIERIDLSGNSQLLPFLAKNYLTPDDISALKHYSSMTNEELTKIQEQKERKTKELKQAESDSRREKRELEKVRHREKTEREAYFGSSSTSRYGLTHKLRERMNALLKLEESGICLYCQGSLSNNTSYTKECSEVINQLVLETGKAIPGLAKDRHNYTTTSRSAMITNKRMDAYSRSGESLVTTTTKRYSNRGINRFSVNHFPKLQGSVCRNCNDEFIKKASNIFKRLQRRRFKKKHFADKILDAMINCHIDYMKLFESMVAKRGL